ncbi:MAG TPA: helix-turn-helix domain-containing protein [Candidatus Polarisedimenticolaceae bacterium]|nr:helix-turn-helix domain-containing protein [Candidatus Polarisedimenticolaceae bacterium]
MGNFVRSVREAQNLSQDEVAEITQGQPWALSRSAISGIERGRSLPSVEALVGLSRALHFDPNEVIERVERALHPGVTSPSEQADERRAEELFWAGRHRDALMLYDALIAAVEARDEAGDSATTEKRALYEIRRAACLRRCGMLLSAKAAAERGVSLAAGHPSLQADGYLVLSATHRQRGNLPLAKDMADRAVRLTRGSDSPGEARALLQAGACLFDLGRFREALRTLLEARKSAVKHRDHRHLSHISGNIGMCWVGLDDRARAKRWVRRAYLLAREHELPALEASWLVELGRFSLDEGRTDDAAGYARAAVDIARSRQNWLTLLRAEWLRHLVKQRTSPGRADRRRIVRLRALLQRLTPHATDPTVKEVVGYLRAGLQNDRGER